MGAAIASGCSGGGAQPPSSATCLGDIQEQVLKASARGEGCQGAQARVDVLLDYDKACQGFFGDAGVNVCAKVKDAGGTADAR